MADKKYSIDFTMSDGTTESVEFTVPQYVLTEDDKAAIVADVIAALGGQPVSGYVDENKIIHLSANIANGEYYAQFDTEDGSAVPIGSFVLGDTEPDTPALVNMAEPNTTNTTDWSIWCNDSRMGGDGTYRKLAGYATTNWLEVEQGDYLIVDGFLADDTANYPSVGFFKEDKTLNGIYYKDNITANGYAVYERISENRFKLTFNNAVLAYPMYVRISAKIVGSAMDVVITKNQEIE